MKSTGPARSLSDLRRDDRGVSLVFTAVALVALLGGAAIAIDLGMAYTARTEAQRAADAAALAGAGSLAIFPDAAGLARREALEFAGRHEVGNEGVDETEVDVNVDTGEDTVGVTVYRDAGHNNPLTTLFARVLGFETVDVSAHAVAEAAPTNPLVPCTLPITLPDRWHEPDGTEPDPNDSFDPSQDTYDPAVTGYNAPEHYGMELELWSGQSPGSYNPSWWGPYRRFNTQGAEDYRSQIMGCTPQSEDPQGLGDQLHTEPGKMQGPTRQGFDDLIGQDPHVEWRTNAQIPQEQRVPMGQGGCVWDTQEDKCTTNTPRIRPAPFFHPGTAPSPGTSGQFTISNFGNFFVVGMKGNDVIVRFLGLAAQHGGDPGGPGSDDDLFKAVRLIE